MSGVRCRLFAYGPVSQTPSSLASLKSRLVLPFWYRLTEIVVQKRPLNGCNSSSLLLLSEERVRNYWFYEWHVKPELSQSVEYVADVFVQFSASYCGTLKLAAGKKRFSESFHSANKWRVPAALTLSSVIAKVHEKANILRVQVCYSQLTVLMTTDETRVS